MPVDTAQWWTPTGGGKVCQVCHSSKDVEDKRQFVFDCPALLMVCSSRPLVCQTPSLILSQMHKVVLSESVSHVGSLLNPYETFHNLNLKLDLSVPR